MHVCAACFHIVKCSYMSVYTCFSPQDQFVHDAHRMRHSVHSYTQQPSVSSHMHSVYEEREDGTAEERVRSLGWQVVPGNRERQERKRERGRRRRSSGEELTQPLYPSHHPPHPSMITFSQPGEPEIKTTRSLSQINHTHSDHAHQYYQHLNKDRQSSSMSQRGGMGSIGRVEKDAMTGESRQYSGPGTSFSPNHPSHHHSSHHHHGNVELIGHQPLVASHSHGYDMTSQYGNGIVMQGKVPHSRIGMGPADGSCRGGREMEDGPIDWEVTLDVCVCVCMCTCVCACACACACVCVHACMCAQCVLCVLSCRVYLPLNARGKRYIITRQYTLLH